MRLMIFRRMFVLCCVLTCCVAGVTRSFAGDAGPAEWEPKQLWVADLPGDITGACFQLDASGSTTYFVCANKKLLALNSEGNPRKDFREVPEPVTRLVPLRPVQGQLAFVGFENWGKQILFLDQQGRSIGKHALPDLGIDWIAVGQGRLLAGMNGDGGLRMYDLKTDQMKPELIERWADTQLGNCWNVALGNFGGGFVAVASEAGGELYFLTADGKRKTARKFGYVASVDVLPLSSTESVVLAINEPSSDDEEELVAVRPERVVFRARIGKSGKHISWRASRLVAGRFVDGKLFEVAVLRGDGSVVLFDQTGQPVNMLPAISARTAIELGPPHNGHDTLLCCDGNQLRRFAFLKAMPAEIAKARATIKNPNAEVLKISERDSAEDLWARALWLSVPVNKASSDEVAGLFTAALSRAKIKAPIYVSFGDTASGPNIIRETFERATQTMSDAVVADIASGVIERSKTAQGLKGEAASRFLEQIIQDSFRHATQHEGVLREINALSKTIIEGTDASAMYYLAAIAEDPEFKPAWLRLATRAKGAKRASAAEAFIRHDPENAIPYYLRAMAEIETGDLVAALKSVQMGNSKTVCRFYSSPRPTTFTLQYPDNEMSREYGVVGESLGSNGLDYLVDSFDQLFAWANPLDHDIRDIARNLVEEGVRRRRSGRVASAIEYLEATYEMGFRLMRAEPRDGLTLLTGVGCAGAAHDDLKSVYQSLGEKAKLQRLSESETARSRFREEFAKTLSASKLSNDVVAATLRGKKHPLDENRQRAGQALIKAGIIKAPDAKNGGKQNPDDIGNLRGIPLHARFTTPVSPKPKASPAPTTVKIFVGVKAGEERSDNGLGIKLVWIPPGSFLMGSPASEKRREGIEAQVQVSLTKGFWMGKYEVTQQEYERLTGTNPSCFSRAGEEKNSVAGEDTSRFPVENVSWDDAVEFCRWLTQQEQEAGRLPAGEKYSLPTEAQWEYACRAGTTTPFHFGATNNGLQANVKGDEPYGTIEEGPSLERPTRVGSYKPNAWTLFDMHGNVSEWCRDWGKDKLLGGRDPEETNGDIHRVSRGGCWYFGADNCRAAGRDFSEPSNRAFYQGFRVVLER